MSEEFDATNIQSLVDRFSSESFAYLRQLHIWLGVGSASAAIAVVSLATNLPDPGYAIQQLLPSLWCFLIGVVAAALGLFALAMRAESARDHFAAAHNRSQFNIAVRELPEVLSAPLSIAEKANVRRSALKDRSKTEHDRAETAWRHQRRWKIAWVASTTVSAVAFIVGFAWPLANASFLGEGLVR